jgi:NTP pyrophosphatase (non-canonical NTP hydrolase)
MPRKDIVDFAEAMEAKMAKYDRSRGDSWKEENFEFLMDRLDEERDELYEKSGLEMEFEMMSNDDLESLIKEAPDVANFAMMIWFQAKRQLEGRRRCERHSNA